MSKTKIRILHLKYRELSEETMPAVVIDGEVVRTLLIGCPKSLFVYPCIAEFDVSRPLGVGPSVRGQSAIPTQLNVSSEWSLFMVASEKD